MIIVIPSRYLSSRLPFKALKDICAYPLIVRVCQQASKDKAKSVIVATDNEQIKKVCVDNNFDAFLTKINHVNGTERICEVVKKIKLPDNEIVVNVQGDEPLIPPDLINSVAECLQNDKDADISTAALPISSLEEFLNPNVVKVVLDKNNFASTFTRAPSPWPRDVFKKEQKIMPKDLPAFRHIGIYGYRCSFLKKYMSLDRSKWEEYENL